MENRDLNPGGEGIKAGKPNKHLTGILIALAIVLTVLIVILGWLLHDRKQESIKLESVTREKLELIIQFESLSEEYSTLQTDNDTINAQLERRQEEIEKLIADLNRTRATNAATINQYRNELGTLRDVLKSYIVQVDSLNQANIRLREENVQVRQQAQMAQTQLRREREVTEDLTSQVQLGSRLVAENISALPINRRGREISRIGRTEQIQVCFTLKRNAIAKQGMRTVHLVIKRPDQLVLASSASNIMEIDGEMMAYTASREINYENVDIDACIFYDDDGSLISGTYRVELYTEGYLIGSTEFSLR